MAEKKKILYIVEAMGGGVFTYIVDPAMTISNGRLRFNTACLKKFENVEYR